MKQCLIVLEQIEEVDTRYDFDEISFHDSNKLEFDKEETDLIIHSFACLGDYCKQFPLIARSYILKILLSLNNAYSCTVNLLITPAIRFSEDLAYSLASIELG